MSFLYRKNIRIITSVRHCTNVSTENYFFDGMYTSVCVQNKCIICRGKYGRRLWINTFVPHVTFSRHYVQKKRKFGRIVHLHYFNRNRQQLAALKRFSEARAARWMKCRKCRPPVVCQIATPMLATKYLKICNQNTTKRRTTIVQTDLLTFWRKFNKVESTKYELIY